MKIDNLIKMIAILPKNESEAKTSEQIASTFFLLPSSDDPEKQGTKNTFIRRQIDAMEGLAMIGTVYGGKAGQGGKRYDRYYLKESSLLKYFMNSKVALNVIWASGIMKSLGPVYGSEDVNGTARAARMNQREKVFAAKIRMVPDGISRENAEIKPEVLKPILDALEKNHSLMLRYHDRQGVVSDEVKQELEKTVLALVAKDGTIYVITCRGFDDVPVHIPMHRIEIALETGSRAYTRPDFVLDDYIAGQHQLAHVLHDQESPIKVVLKVDASTIFHFRERPITGNQEISKTKDKDGRYTVTVTVPFTVQLPPFIWSHAGWVEVISPPALRKYVGERLLAAADHYRQDIEVVR
jgi:predicted DNA-binding transcriptional regulator YafY